MVILRLGLVLLASLASCSLPEAPPPSKAPPATAAEVDSTRLARAHRRYDAKALAALLEQQRGREGITAWRLAGRAALHLAEILKLQATAAEESGDDARLGPLVARRLQVASEGLTAVDRALRERPDDAELLFLKGELHAYRIKDVASGVREGRLGRPALLRSLQLNPDDPAARLAWIKQYYYLPRLFGGDLQRAERELRELLGRAPGFEPGWAFLGQVLLALQQPTAARAAFERARRLNPHSLRANVYMPRREAPQ